MRAIPRRLVFFVVTVILTAFTIDAVSSPQQQLDELQRGRALDMLRDFAIALRENYYDPSYHGVDMDARFREAKEKIEKATSLGQTFAAIAVAVDGLNDSHTHFLPPERPLRLDYGYRLRMNGDACFVSEIRLNTDAATKLHVGDQILKIEGFLPTRDGLVKLNYYFNQIYPRAVMHLLVRDAAGAERQTEVQTAAHPTKRLVDLTMGGASGGDIWDIVREEETREHLFRQRHVEVSDSLMIWKMPVFDLKEDEMDRLWGMARKHATVILDLRGNPGGYVTLLQRMIGSVMDHEVKIGDRVGRKDLKPLVAKSRGSNIFTGKLIVLVDSSSASAAEIFARVVQLEHRGTVLGDRSSGMVMESKYYPLHEGIEKVIFFGATITHADLIMTDGKSLEHNGVMPDEVVLPSAADLAAGRDPVLAHAAEVAGVKLDPAEAGKMFPFEWLPL
jgi:C-terminal processing protease CtpA/Prc